MNDIAIEFENVSKKFKRGEKFDSLRDLIPALAKKLRSGKKDSPSELKEREFWALRDVSFQVKKGEALGIIGSNGAGKSTVLKILSGIIRPTNGHYRINGRLSALIEVGAGFHPDLSGRENVFLNGAILGMTPKEISTRFDEIVDFSGLTEFIDTPVKRYSSGMYARLGFSVAIHMKPDVLLVDEVLSVGDMAFQAKCQQKMQEVANSGASIVFISHNLYAIAALCKQTLILRNGRPVMKGSTTEAIKVYCELANSPSDVGEGTRLVLQHVEIADIKGQPGRTFRSGQSFLVRLNFLAQERLEKVAVGLWLRGPTGEQIFHISTQRMHMDPIDLVPGQEFGVQFELAANLCSGSYIIGAVAKRYDRDVTYLVVEPVGNIEIVAADDSGGIAWLSPSCKMLATGSLSGMLNGTSA